MARRHKTPKVFPATHESLWLENRAADEMGYVRIQNEQELFALVDVGVLAPLDGLIVAKKLPPFRRYALPATVEYARKLNGDFYDVFSSPLVVTSAVRPADVQRKLRRRNRNAAPESGDRGSTHQRGTTFDISKRLSRPQYRWLVLRLLRDRALHRVLVIEEKACFHIFVGGQIDVY